MHGFEIAFHMIKLQLLVLLRNMNPFPMVRSDTFL